MICQLSGDITSWPQGYVTYLTLCCRHIDWVLMSTFVDWWYFDMNIFHLFPFGEIMIILHNIYHIIHISVDKELVTTCGKG